MINSGNPDFSNHPCSDARAVFPYRPAEATPRPVVSVITPYYNTDEVFPETARSLFSQSFQEWEWIIVDDGSTDPASLKRLADVAGSDSRVRVVHQENKGLPLQGMRPSEPRAAPTSACSTATTCWSRHLSRNASGFSSRSPHSAFAIPGR